MALGFTLARAWVELKSRGMQRLDRDLTGVHRRLALIKNAALGIGSFAAIGGPAALGTFGFMTARAAMEAETSYARVRKVMGMTREEFESVRKEIDGLGRDLAGISNQSLRGIAQVGGQIGVPSGELSKFVEDIAKAEIALQVSGESAANSMSELDQQFGFGLTNVDKVTSAINEMANTTRASAADVLEITRRISGAGATAGMAVPEVVALATSLKQAGVSSEIAGTFVSKLIRAISTPKQWEDFASAVNMTEESFGRMVQSNPFEALRTVIGELNRAEGTGAFEFLEEIGVQDARGAGAILQLARAFDTLDVNVKRATQGFEDGTSVNREYAIFADTTAGQVQKLTNQLQQLFEQMGEAMLPAIRSVSEEFERWLAMEGDFERLGLFWENFANNLVAASNAMSTLVESSRDAGFEERPIVPQMDESPNMEARQRLSLEIARIDKELADIQSRTAAEAARDALLAGLGLGPDVDARQQRLLDERSRRFRQREELEVEDREAERFVNRGAEIAKDFVDRFTKELEKPGGGLAMGALIALGGGVGGVEEPLMNNPIIRGEGIFAEGPPEPEKVDPRDFMDAGRIVDTSNAWADAVRSTMDAFERQREMDEAVAEQKNTTKAVNEFASEANNHLGRMVLAMEGGVPAAAQ